MANEIPNNMVEIHPISIREIKKGHPWILADTFTERFPGNHSILIASDKKKNPVCIFLHDPAHKHIKGRVWSLKQPFAQELHNFSTELSDRLEEAISKRARDDHHRERDNFYLVFGEADFLPGLFIQALGKHVLIQFYSGFWHERKSLLLRYLQHHLKNSFPHINRNNIWIQKRSDLQNKTNLPKSTSGKKSAGPRVKEFGITYKAQLGSSYDQGIYTDMASIRKKILPYMQENPKVLNLFSYSGVYSLFALKNGAQHVTSIDSSKQAMDWLEQNFALNPEISKDNHSPMLRPVQKALPMLQKDGKSYDLIICDPPSSSSDGRKRTTALQFYEKFIPSLVGLLATNGKLVIFLNTHRVSQKKFVTKIEKSLEKHSVEGISIIGNLSLGEDCPQRPRFEEGSYLKGIILKRS